MEIFDKDVQKYIEVPLFVCVKRGGVFLTTQSVIQRGTLMIRLMAHTKDTGSRNNWAVFGVLLSNL